MKICPFISHMIDDDNANILQINDSSSERTDNDQDAEERRDSGVVILGYDDGSSGAVATKSARSKKASSSIPSHLYCLENTCRFYGKRAGGGAGECGFDVLFENVKKQLKAATAKPAGKSEDDKMLAKIDKDLDKFWKFQTKSVAELISSLGEADKDRKLAFDDFKARLEEGLEEITAAQPDNNQEDVKSGFEELKKSFANLQEAIDSREDGLDNFSTTVSELVLNIDDTLRSLKDNHENLSERIESLTSSVRTVDEFHKKLKSTIEEKIEKLDDLKTPQVSDDVKSMSEKLESLLSAHKRVEERMDSLVENLETRIREVSERQNAWNKRFDELTEGQSEVMELIRHDRDRRDDDSFAHKRKEAKKYNNLGVTSFHNGAFEMARDQFLQAVALDPNFAESYNNLGLVYTELHEEEKATDAFSKAIELNPDLPAVYNNLGYVFYKQGSYDQAIEMYNQALGRSSDNSSAYTNLGNAYFKQGNREEARRAWEKALEIDPSNDKAAQNLKRLENG